MDFFRRIAALEFTGSLQMNIAKGTESNLVVSVLLHNEGCGDNAKNLIPPLTFNATPQEFDDCFFEQIAKPIQTVSGVMVDMEKFLKQMEHVKKQSAMEKEKTERTKKEKESRDKKFNDAMAKVEELEKDGKHREAWMLVQKMSDFPEHREQIKKKSAALAQNFAPDLFAAAPTPTQQPMPEPLADDREKDTYYPTYEVADEDLNWDYEQED